MGRPTNSLKHKFDEILESESGIPKFKRMMAATTKAETYIHYFRECLDRSSVGKAIQVNENFNHDDDRPTTTELDAALRSLNGHSTGNGVAEGK